ncbi:MAG TPA: ankyrin repeat domain-containing protein [Bacteroidota bacterium]|nr:ankyrin repeat domain-containing protein [Bacteroidota bacterium]
MIPVSELCEIIRSGKNDRLESLFMETPGLADAKTDQGISILTFACYCRNTGAVGIIRQHKKNLDCFEAASAGDFRTLESYLSTHPSSINSYSVDGFTLLGLSCFFGHREIAEFLVHQGADVNLASNNTFHVAPLHSACAISDFAIAELLLNNGADPNATQQAGVTPLHEAAHHGRTDLAQLLLNYKANVNARTEIGQTPLAMAKEGGFAETALFLQKNGAS